MTSPLVRVHSLTTRVEAPVEEVFEWHRRPGAIHRLMPPWMPGEVRVEATDLADGTAVLSLGRGVDWVARHDPEAYEAPHLFTDRLASLRPLSWTHRHEFAASGDATLVTDRIETNVLGKMVDRMLGYRHAQLAADLAAHHRTYAAGKALTVAVTGSHGTVGRALVPFLTTGGHRVLRLVRHAPTGADERRWDPAAPAPDLLDGVDAVVHLAGASIAGRFTEAHKAAIRDSRIEPTRRLAVAAARGGVRTFVSASAIGIYGADRGAEVLSETSSRGGGFLADVVDDWEAASRVDGPRVVNVRTGIVQTPAGGALRLQRPLFAAGLGGPLGSGEQWLSWIGIDDLVDIYHRAILDPGLEGPVNAVAPEPVTGRVYARTLAHVLRRPALLPTPAFGPRLLLGKEGADEMALASQRVEPAALGADHEFRHPSLEAALRHVLGR
ncbi:TIGR01777 family protein [Nocardioides sp. KC13]|uniref:TIGR01777 family protein n=1 Tax=Nocardioides turkmenicus TaxID=2711220 RepID=A0A6M1QVU2_9ACTN|nr:TIGR01777 family oxidoreductase [Nocardioides sp. KC13]NGN91984.1 TIGR01777 family protein [Nocardioides sp. KC13]